METVSRHRLVASDYTDVADRSPAQEFCMGKFEDWLGEDAIKTLTGDASTPPAAALLPQTNAVRDLPAAASAGTKTEQSRPSGR
jgi:hypothetical protein